MDMLKLHTITHSNLAEEIVSNVEKHLEEKCKKLEETLISERLTNMRNIAHIDELKAAVKQADERTRDINKIVEEKDVELVKCKDNLTKEICLNEQKANVIDNLNLKISAKDAEITKLREKSTSNDNCKKHEEEVSKLTGKLEETRDLCLEYKH